MRTADFDYDLPQELIAREPTARRDECRLLHLPPGAAIEHRRFSDLPELLRPGDLLVLNDTRVLRARLMGERRPGRGAAEVLLLEPQAASSASDVKGFPLEWTCLVRPGRKLRAGARIDLGEGLFAEIMDVMSGGERRVRFHLPEGANDFRALIERAGHPPLPPYILAARKKFEHDASISHPEDARLYQTVFAREGLSVAAPTAGLHFTDELLARLEASGIERAYLRLDVGAGTFKPVEEEDPREHPMHSENYWIAEEQADRINDALGAKRRVVAVGTTALRALEAAALESEAGRVAPGARATDLLILPGYRFRVVSGLTTNFHLPRSTLLMLVAAVAGRERILAAYDEAIRERYRFYSYGDAMLVWNAE